MLQEIFRIPFFNIPVYGYGVMLVIGFFASMELARFLARRSGLDPEAFANCALIALVAGVAGARLSHVLENLHDYTRSDLSVWQNFVNMINIRSGGLTYYGGFLLAFPACVAYGIMKRVPLRLGMDIIAPCLMVGLGFGRIGCYLNGCCYGAESNLPIAVRFPYHSNAYLEQFENGEIQVPPQLLIKTSDGKLWPMSLEEADREGYGALAREQKARPVQPAELYSAFTAFLIAAFLIACFTLPHVPGRIFAGMMIIEGVCRYLLELLRVEPPVIGRMSLSMVLGLLIAAAGIALWFAFGAYDNAHPAARPAAATAAAAI